MPPERTSKKSKTSRFPVARIKKIMQLDEEVGKLASATPVMISKSLECFLQLLLEETSKETRNRGSKKLTAYHLKQTINQTPSFDFLLPLTASIPDPALTEPKPAKSKTPRKASNGNGKSKGKAKKREDEDDEEEEEGNEDEMEEVKPAVAGRGVPKIEANWGKEEMDTVGGGRGEGGRGMFDDYEDDEDDY